MTSDGTNSYSWNARNKLASMNSSSISFQYDPYGRRVAKTVAGSTTNYLYDGANIVQELSSGSPIANLLSGGIDEVFTRTDSTGTANFLTDGLNSTINLRNSSGSSLAQYAYDPFGNTTVTSGSSANEFQYAGRENDGTGVYFNRARYYSTTLQRFISEDPAFPVGGINGYAYASNNPMFWADPFGLSPTPITPWDRLRLLGAGTLNLFAAQEKVAAAAALGVLAPVDGGITLPGAIYEATTAAPTAVTGLMQIGAAITGSSGLSQAADAVSVFTSISGPITLLATGGNVEMASTASTIEGLTTFGLSGSFTPVGVGNAINGVLDLVYPMKK